MERIQFEKFLRAISGQESGGNYNAVNTRTGAHGKYQIMPANWKAWTKEFGMEGAEPTPENQEKIARYKLRQYYDKYGARGASIAWYAGEGALKYSQKALNRKQGRGDEPSINEYADSIMRRMGMVTLGNHDTILFRDIQNWEGFENVYPVENPSEGMSMEEDPSAPDLFFTSMWTSIKDSPLGTMTADIYTRFKYAGIDRPLLPSEKEVINDLLKDDPDYAKHLTTSGYPSAVAMSMANRRADIIKDQKELEQFNEGIINAVTVGNFLGETVTDPTILLPTAKVGKALAKIVTTFGGVLPNDHSIVMSTARVMAEAGAGSLLNNAIDEEWKGNEKTAGEYWNDAWSSAFLVGGLNVLGRSLPAVASSQYVEDIKRTIYQAQTTMMRNAVGLPAHTPNTFKKSWEKTLKYLDNGYFGKMYYSLNPLVKSSTKETVKDARQRVGGNEGVTLEEKAEIIYTQLRVPMREFLELKDEWLRQNLDALHFYQRYTGVPEELYKKVVQRYDQKYGRLQGNKLYTEDPLIEKMVDKLHEMRELQLKIGKQYGIVDEAWYAVDPAYHRVVNKRKRYDFINACGSEDEAIKRIEKYLKEITKKEKDGGYCFKTTKAKMVRERELENQKRAERGEEAKDTEVTDEEVEAEIEKGIHETAVAWIRKNYDMQDSANFMEGHKLKNIGRLSPFGRRLSVDTSLEVEIDGKMFSFDDMLRDWDVDTQLDRNYHRFAGETAFIQKFKDQNAWDAHIREVDKEYLKLVQDQKLTKQEAESERKAYIDMMNEIRGMRNTEEGYSTSRAYTSLLRALTYAVRGTNMGFNQLGEIGGAIAFGGAKQIYRIMPFIGKYLEKNAYKEANAESLERTACQMIAMDAGEYMLKDNPFDAFINERFFENKLSHKVLRGLGEVTNLMRKGTSMINRLPYMTHSMLTGLCKDAIYQCLLKAHGKTNRRIEYMFEEKNLQTLGIKDTESFLASIRKYTIRDDKGNIKDLDIRKWQEEDHDSYAQFYSMVTRYTENGLTQTDSIGGRNLIVKDMHPVLQLFMQFKDFSLRALNGQVLRAWEHKDIMNGSAIILSGLSSTMSLALRSYIPYQTYLMMGEKEKAEEHYKKYCQPEDLVTQGFIRSVYFSPASFFFDMYEIGTGEDLNRRTTTKQKYNQIDPNEPVSSRIKVAVEQIPSVDMMNDLWKATASLNPLDDKNTDDIEALMAIFPLKHYVPISAFLDTLIQRNLKY